MSTSSTTPVMPIQPLSDPLPALGPSLFLLVFSHLPFDTLLTAELVSRQWHSLVQSHEKGIWRSACHRTDVEDKSMKTMEATERALSVPQVWYGERGGGVDWREMCKSLVGLGRNWKFGRCRERWITMPGNAVWRFKLDPEDNTMLCTSRLGQSPRMIALHVERC